jgi:hypothetical protein
VNERVILKWILQELGVGVLGWDCVAQDRLQWRGTLITGNIEAWNILTITGGPSDRD